MLILVDTREQKPLWEGETTTRRVKLEVGDYTTLSLHNKAHAERKSGEDLYGSIIQGHERFRRMLIRAHEKGIKVAIFVECDEEKFYLKQFKRGYGRQVPGHVLEKIITTIKEKYLVEVYWCWGRNHMRSQMREWFARMEVEHAAGTERSESGSLHN